MASENDTGAPIVGARERARAEVHAAILAAARARLERDGADQLSLRAVARDVGMVSSAVYRYVASRDALLTALIIESYDALGEHVEAGVDASVGRPAADRWVDTAMSIRQWALDHPNDFALLYGTPIRGYAAPEDTVGPGTRVSRALVRIVREADQLDPIRPATIAPVLTDSFEALRAELDLDVDDGVVLAIITAWTQLFGLLTFELFGQTRNLVADDALPICRSLDGRVDRAPVELTRRRATCDRTRTAAGRPCASGSPRSPR